MHMAFQNSLLREFVKVLDVVLRISVYFQDFFPKININLLLKTVLLWQIWLDRFAAKPV